jgi:hypothetical protein
VLPYIPEGGVMIELGAYWGYYSLWFATSVPHAKNYLIEPDLRRLETGKRNFQLNDKAASFYHGYVGIKDNDDADFTGASPILIDPFLQQEHIPHVHILHADIQGAECAMLSTCTEAIQQGKIDYFFISTHHELGHQFCLDFFCSYDYQIIAEHKPKDSCSIDGLVVAKRKNCPGPAPVLIHKYAH